MTQYRQLEEWKGVVSMKFPNLSKPQASILAMWSFGMVIVGACGLTTICAFLAELLGLKENSLRQRFKEWYKDAKDKKGDKRQEIDVKSCFQQDCVGLSVGGLLMKNEWLSRLMRQLLQTALRF